MIPFSPPRIDQKIIDSVVEALRSGWITTGPKTKLFEKKLAEYCGVPSVLCLNSATAGLELMLRWYGVGEGDEVILPAYTYSATANVIIHCGARPVFVDINESDFNISIHDIKKAITPRTKVIMPVDLAGYPCDYNELNDLVQSAEIRKIFSQNSEEQEKLGRILILADAAHSIGAVYRGIRAGALTDATVFSFHAVKNLTTSEGGAICFNLPAPFDNSELYKAMNIKSLHGQNKDALAKSQKGSWRYDIVEAGYKCNMTDLSASIGLVELERYDNDMLVKRKKIFSFYTEQLSKHPWARIPVYESNVKKSSYHVYLLRINNITERERDAIITQIFEREVSVNVHFVPVPMMSFYKSIGYNIADYPQAFANYACEISLPVYYDLSDQQMMSVVNAVIDSVKQVTGI